MKTITGITEDLTTNQLSPIDNFIVLYNQISHHLYVDLFIKKLPIKDLFPIFQYKYLVGSRHLKSILKVLEGKIASILALNKNYLADTLDNIKSLEKTLKTQHKNYQSYLTKQNKGIKLTTVEQKSKESLHTKIKYNHIRLDRAKSKLIKLQEIKDTSNPHLCFGSNKLFRQQFQINSNNNQTKFKSKQDWDKEWFYQRHKEATFIGSKDETAGNTNAQITHIKDNLFSLKLNINHKADKLTDKYLNIQFKVDYETQTLINIINNNQGKNKDLWQALTYKLIKKPSKSHNRNKYVVAISFEKYLIKDISTDINKGVLGVDINQDHLAVSNLDNKGNLLSINTYEYDLNGNKYQNENNIALAVKDLMSIAVKLNKPIVIEQLDFSNKKKSLSLVKNKSNYSKNRNKQLSSFSYSKIIELIRARAEDNGIEVIEVNPAYTSMIGSIKYAVRSRISIHHSAAMCIGRKGLFNNYNEDKKLVKEYKEKRISSKNRYIKAMDLPARNNLKTHIYWKELKENMVKSNQHKNKSSSNATNSSTSLGISTKPVMNGSVGTLS